MAVAVKQTSEPGGIESHPILDRLPYVCLAGVAYVLGSLGIVFKLLPSLLIPVLADAQGKLGNAGAVVLGMIMLVAATALVFLGGKLMGSNAPPGARAGIFTCLVGLLFILLLARWVSLWIEHWVYRDYPNSWFVGAVVTAIIGLAMLAYAIRLLFKKGTEKTIVAFEAQGWFSATAYKPLQGQKVRRGTILGLLLIAGAGIYTLHTHGTLKKGSSDWELAIPFTGKVLVTYEGDVGEQLQGLPPEKQKEVDQDGKKVKYPYVDRYELRALNDKHADPKEYIKLVEANDADSLRGQEGTIIRQEDFQAATQKLRAEFDRENEKVLDDDKLAQLRAEFEARRLPKGVPPEPAGGPVTFDTLTLLPSMQFTLPLVLLALSLWLAWRIVNQPMFADFLIATEAELNKVSWTTRKRLYQDTIVVLTCVILMAGFLFSMDQVWRIVLSSRPIGVLQFPEDEAEKEKGVEDKPW